MTRHLRRAFLATFFLAFSIGFLSAGTTVSWIEGDVTVLHNGIITPAEIEGEVFVGDRITTGPDSLVILEIGSRGILKLRADSSLVLENLDEDISVKLLWGGVFSKIRRLIGRGYNVRTPNVVAAVRGTEFFVAYGRTVEAEADVWLCVNEGTVEVALENADDKVLVKEGEGINILAASHITDPKYYPWTENLNWNTDPSSGTVVDSTDLDAAYTDLRAFDYD